MQGRLGRKRSAGVSCCEVSFQSVTIVSAAQIGRPLKFYPSLKKRVPIVSIGPGSRSTERSHAGCKRETDFVWRGLAGAGAATSWLVCQTPASMGGAAPAKLAHAIKR